MKLITNVVKQLLEQDAALRDSDMRLIAEIWKRELIRFGIPENDVKPFFEALSKGILTSTESITRSRRKVQEEYEELRGKKYALRQAAQKEVRKTINQQNRLF